METQAPHPRDPQGSGPVTDTPSPPNSPEVEEALLGCLLMWPDEAAQIVLPTLKPEDFFVEVHQNIARFLMEGIEDGRPADAVTLGHYIRSKHPGLDTSFVVRIQDAAPSGANLPGLTDIVKEYALKRGIIQAAAIFSEEGRNGKRAVDVLSDHRVRVEDLDKEAAGARLPIVDGPALEKMDFPPRISIVGNRILEEGGFLSIISEEGVGKTWLSVDLAAMMARGEGGLWLGLPVAAKKMPVLVLYGEGGLDGAKDRSVKVAGSLPEGMLFMTPEQLPLDLNDPRDISRLRTTVEWLKARYSVPSIGVIVDPQANWSNHNENEDGGPFYKRLNDFRLKTRTTLIVSHHTNKQVVEKGNARSARGSSRFPAIVDAALVLNRETDGTVRATWGKLRNAAPMEAGIFRLSGETLKFEFQSTVNNRASLKERIFSTLEDERLTGEGWLTKRQIMLGSGAKERTVEKWLSAQTAMEKVETRGEPGTMCQYRLVETG